MKNNKMNKVYEVMNGNKRGLNLHEIKAITGIGNGYKDTTMNATPVVTINEGEKINRVATNKKRRVNLHKIKAQTGAGNGHKSSNIVDLINNISNNIVEVCSHKSHKINEVLNNSRNLNLYQIKALTGAGSGYRQ